MSLRVLFLCVALTSCSLPDSVLARGNAGRVEITGLGGASFPTGDFHDSAEGGFVAGTRIEYYSTNLFSWGLSLYYWQFGSTQAYRTFLSSQLSTQVSAADWGVLGWSARLKYVLVPGDFSAYVAGTASARRHTGVRVT